MMKWITVTPEQVRAARLELQALETAGLTPDPMLRKLAAAVEPGAQKARAPKKLRHSSDSRSEAHERATAENRELWSRVRASNVRTGRSRRLSTPAPPPPPLSSASFSGAIDEVADELRAQAEENQAQAEYLHELAQIEERQRGR